jgi:hypothetical protein
MLINRETFDLLGRRHPEWQEHCQRWRWLLDSLEGGERYRQAVYGYDRRGLPVRNLIRHKREYPDPREASGAFPVPGADPFTPAVPFVGDPGTLATDDDYELRRARTPVPTFLAEAVETHLARIYSREIRRLGPDPLMDWWQDVDGCGTTIDQWMAEAVAPLLLTLGQLDLCFDHPPAPPGEAIRTRSDLLRLGLDSCVASCILPENMLWWRLDETGQRYEECLVLERHESGVGPETRYRHWTAEGSTLYSDEGEELARIPHPFGRVPIVRVFDRRKPRCRNIGQSRYEGIAERQREYYNRDSELILSDTTQAHPLLQGPEDYVQPDGSVPIGPGWLLPKKKNVGGGNTTYEGFDIIEFPKDGAESIRRNKSDIRDDVDRDASLVRTPAREAVAQSGLAKMIDQADGNNRLAKIARVLSRAERLAAEFALMVLGDGPPEPATLGSIEVVYPAEFDLYTADAAARASADFQAIAARAGGLPRCEALMLSRLLRLCLPGLSDPQYAECEGEINRYLEGRAGGATPPSGIAYDEVARRDVFQDINVI